MLTNKKFVLAFANMIKHAKSKQNDELDDERLLLIKHINKKKSLLKNTSGTTFDVMKFKLVGLCIHVLEETVPILAKKQVSRISFRVSSSKVLDDVESLIKQLEISLEHKIVVKTNKICVDYVLKTSVLKEFVFTSFCLNLDQLSHLIKYDKDDLILY